MIDVHRISDENAWNEYVERAAGGSVFHRYEFLSAVAAETGMELHPLVGKNGEHPIAIFPVFTGSNGPIRMAASPPPYAGVPHLGPATMLDPNIKFRKASLRTKEFVDACVDWLDETVDPHYVRIVTNPAFGDVRPFRWLGFDVSPRFTYELDIDRDEDRLLRSFSRDARRSIEDGYDPACALADGGSELVEDRVDRPADERGARPADERADQPADEPGNRPADEPGNRPADEPGDEQSEPTYAIERGDADAVDFVVAQLERRFAEQGRSFDLSADFVRTIYERLPPEMVEVYRLEADGRPVSGRISLFHDGRLTFWQGVPKPRVDLDLPINDVLNWHTIRRAREKGCDVAELSGANVERLWDYKAKFNPELATYHVVERTAPGVGALLAAYKWWRA